MTDPTPLDEAHARMQAAPEDAGPRMAFYSALAATGLHLLLTEESKDRTLRPQVFEIESGPIALAFDDDDRLGAFLDAPAPHAVVPGRLAVRMLAEKGLGLGLNLEVAPSAFLMPPEAVQWLAGTLAQGPGRHDARPVEVRRPRGVPPALLHALDTRLARAAGLARTAWLAGVSYEDGTRGTLLAIAGASNGAEPVLAAAVQEALALSGMESGALDVTFIAPGDALAARLARVGLRFDLPEPGRPEPPEKTTPKGPPILR